FEPISRRWRLFRRVGGTRRDLVEFPLTTAGARYHETEVPADTGLRRSHRLVELARQVLMDRFAPAAVLIDRKLHVLQFLGRTERFLTQPSGEPTTDLLAMTRDGLRTRLRPAVQEAVREGHAMSVSGAFVK